MRRLGFALVAAAGWFCVPSVLAQPTPPRWGGDGAINVPPTVKRDLVRELRLGSYVATFEKTPLGEIRDKVGSGTLGSSGDAGSSRRWLCYSLPGQRVWLISTPMGGSDYALMQVMAVSISASAPLDPSCPSVPSALSPWSLQFGWIGSPESSLKESFGEPSGTRGEWRTYFYSGQERLPAPGEANTPNPEMVDYDVIAYVKVRVRNGRVSAISASRVTSY